MPVDDVRIERWNPDAAGVEDDLDMLGGVLQACVHAGASVSFILPFSRSDATEFWRTQVLPGVHNASRRVVVSRVDGNIVGTVQIDLATPPNQPHRAEVKKLLVHPDVRRRGIARLLMQAIETQAREARRNLLTLDTVTGGFAEALYRSMGYATSGIIPGYALNFDSSKFEATTVMYKQLAEAE